MFTAKNTLVFKYYLLKATAQIHIHIFTCVSGSDTFLFLCCFQLQLLGMLNVCSLSNQNMILVCTWVMPSNFLIFFMLSATIQEFTTGGENTLFLHHFFKHRELWFVIYTETRKNIYLSVCMSDRIKCFKQSKQIWLFFLFKV